MLWLLACTELDPGLSRISQLLVSPGMHELNAQIVERLVTRGRSGPDGKLLDRLIRLGLIETTQDPRVPLHRRAVRPSDRVLELVRGRLVLEAELAGLATLESAVEIDGRCNRCSS
ncbi:MAG: hypothetical protein H0T89_27045 [Deltaproteobacteria bacterium]|nr:hypothetical protein [Deltaproteobacteria bacterium]MDQ3295427.1 hypothetical protein [Myxococcota bacterium]